jgi:hypothetical protein
LGPQQTPASTSGGGAKDTEQDEGFSDFDKLARGCKDCVMIVIIPFVSATD